MRPVLLVAFNTTRHHQDGQKQCVLDIIDNYKNLSTYGNNHHWGSILCYEKSTWLNHCKGWKQLTRSEFEDLYGRIEYP